MLFTVILRRHDTFEKKIEIRAKNASYLPREYRTPKYQKIEVRPMEEKMECNFPIRYTLFTWHGKKEEGTPIYEEVR